VNGLLICGLAAAVRAASRPLDRIGLLPLVIAATISFPISFLFLIEVAAPAILDLPYHHCPYDLLPKAPEAVVAVCSYLLGMFAVGWAGLTAWLADCPETRSFLSDEIGGLLRLALFGYTGALAMIYVEMTLS
jgi:hypothetical protein